MNPLELVCKTLLDVAADKTVEVANDFIYKNKLKSALEDHLKGLDHVVELKHD